MWKIPVEIESISPLFMRRLEGETFFFPHFLKYLNTTIAVMWVSQLIAILSHEICCERIKFLLCCWVKIFFSEFQFNLELVFHNKKWKINRNFLIQKNLIFFHSHHLMKLDNKINSKGGKNFNWVVVFKNLT